MADNDNLTLYITQQKDEKTGLTGLFAPHIFHSECNELGIIADKSRVRFSCAWTFCRAAHQTLESIPAQVTFEDETDITVNLRQALDSFLELYGNLNPNEVMKFMPECRKLAFRRSLIWNPRFQAWLDSAGKSYNIVTREEKFLNKDS